MTTPEISVSLITRNRADRVETFLAKAAAIETRRPWELVIVDNGSTDDTPSVLERARASFPVPVTVVTDPTPGVARARNRGWQAAKAPVVVFTNDDCYLPADYVDRYADAFASDESLGFVAGAVVRHDAADVNLGNAWRPDRFYVRPGMFLIPGDFITANMGFRRGVLESIGGFDEIFAYGNGLVGDDCDAVTRVTAAGWNGVFDPEIVVRHHHGWRPPEEVQRVVKGYAAGRGAFYAKCLLDPRVRWLYLKGWTRITFQRFVRDHTVTPTVRELRGALRYLVARRRRA